MDKVWGNTIFSSNFSSDPIPLSLDFVFALLRFFSLGMTVVFLLPLLSRNICDRRFGVLDVCSGFSARERRFRRFIGDSRRSGGRMNAFKEGVVRRGLNLRFGCVFIEAE